MTVYPAEIRLDLTVVPTGNDDPKKESREFYDRVSSAAGYLTVDEATNSQFSENFGHVVTHAETTNPRLFDTNESHTEGLSVDLMLTLESSSKDEVVHILESVVDYLTGDDDFCVIVEDFGDGSWGGYDGTSVLSSRAALVNGPRIS